MAYSFGQQPGSLEATFLAMRDQVGQKYGSVPIQEADDTFLMCLGTGVRVRVGERGGQTFNALSSARRRAISSVLRLTSSWELV